MNLRALRSRAKKLYGGNLSAAIAEGARRIREEEGREALVAAQATAASGRVIGLTFDTGALIAIERRHERMARVYRTAVLDGLRVTVPNGEPADARVRLRSCRGPSPCAG